MDRRRFIRNTTSLAISSGLFGFMSSCSDLLSEEKAFSLDITVPKDLFFKISLAEWSLHRSLWKGDIDHLDFPKIAREKFGIDAVEYVNQFFFDKARNQSYLNEMKTRSDDINVSNQILMVDMEGSLGTIDKNKRLKSVDNHFKWIDAAKYLGCHSVRVNAAGKGNRKDVGDAVIDSLGRLCEYAEKARISVIVENHGGYSSDADWLVDVITNVNMPNCGTLPDFGNFLINLFPPMNYDRQEGMKKLMPLAKGVSAKSKEFNKEVKNNPANFTKMLRIVKNSGFGGYIGIEYEGYKLSEFAGIRATKYLLVEAGMSI